MLGAQLLLVCGTCAKIVRRGSTTTLQHSRYRLLAGYGVGARDLTSAAPLSRLYVTNYMFCMRYMCREAGPTLLSSMGNTRVGNTRVIIALQGKAFNRDVARTNGKLLVVCMRALLVLLKGDWKSSALLFTPQGVHALDVDPVHPLRRSKLPVQPPGLPRHPVRCN